jgi:hypothetical protein
MSAIHSIPPNELGDPIGEHAARSSLTRVDGDFLRAASLGLSKAYSGDLDQFETGMLL